MQVGLPRWLSDKNLPNSVGEAGLIPGWGRSPGERNGNPPQYSCLENSRTEEPGRLHTVSGVTKSWGRLKMHTHYWCLWLSWVEKGLFTWKKLFGELNHELDWSKQLPPASSLEVTSNNTNTAASVCPLTNLDSENFILLAEHKVLHFNIETIKSSL